MIFEGFHLNEFDSFLERIIWINKYSRPIQYGNTAPPNTGESFPLYHSMNLFVYFDFDTLCSYP